MGDPEMNQPNQIPFIKVIRSGARDSDGDGAAVSTTAHVRRLTPLECERLMGWPDNHTLHRADGSIQPDSTRYRQCGNGVVANVAEWIAQQINRIVTE